MVSHHHDFWTIYNFSLSFYSFLLFSFVTNISPTISQLLTSTTDLLSPPPFYLLHFPPSIKGPHTYINKCLLSKASRLSKAKSWWTSRAGSSPASSQVQNHLIFKVIFHSVLYVHFLQFISMYLAHLSIYLNVA